MARFISLFPVSGNIHSLTPAQGVLAGDKVVQVFRLDGSGDETSNFGPVISVDGFISELVTLTGGMLYIALLERP